MSKHFRADILRAIADGRQIQYLNVGGTVIDCTPEFALALITDPGWIFMIKPETASGWINIYDQESNAFGLDGVDCGVMYKTKEIADAERKSMHHLALACVEVKYTIGEGL